MEEWSSIPGFENYSVSNHGRIRSEKSDRIMALVENQYGVIQCGYDARR